MRQVTLEHRDPRTDQGVDCRVTVASTKAGEGRLRQQLDHSVVRGHSAAGAYDDNDGCVRKVVEDALEQRLADETCDPSEQQALAGEKVCDPVRRHGLGVNHATASRPPRRTAAAPSPC